jgi:hypothetical protein
MKGSETTCSVSFGVSRATSVSARYFIGGAACAMSQSMGNRTGPVGGGAGGVVGAGAGVVATSTAADSGDAGAGDAGETGLLNGDGRVT